MKSFSTFTHRITHKLFKNQSPVWQRPGLFISLLILIYLAIGLLVVTQYCQSTDEPSRILYAENSLDAYTGKMGILQDEKGPFYGMLAVLGSKVLVHLFAGWEPLDGWHYMSFLSFVMGVYFFYRLCRRLVDQGPAFAATLLFGTQPLLWGHAFINPKDIPFMAFFLASVTLGLEMVDHFQPRADTVEIKTSRQERFAILRQKLFCDWRSASRRLRILLTGLALLLVALALSYPLIRTLIAAVVGKAYIASPSSWLGSFFRQRALHASQIPIQAYIAKAQTQYSWLVLFLGIGLALASIWVAWRVFPSVTRPWSGRILPFLIQPRVWLAGCFLGFSSDIRTLGPASGLLVAVYFIHKAGRKAIPVLLEYLGVGALATYLFWPYLWKSPLSRFISSLSEAADFPWTGNILFAGKLYYNQHPPANYLPVLFTLQFTETALLLTLIGIVLAGFYLICKAGMRMDILLLGVWWIAPLAAAILLHSTVYNNFRQFFFVVPPMFVFTGLALQSIWNRLNHKVILFVPLVCLLLAPGLYGDWQLHPYQYIYYNSLVGGVAGASGNYDIDYWDSSFREAIEYVNQAAPENAAVSIWPNKKNTVPYARPDLNLISFTHIQDPGYPLNTLADYAVISTRSNSDQVYFPSSKVIYQVRRGGAILAVVKQVNKGDLIQSK